MTSPFVVLHNRRAAAAARDAQLSSSQHGKVARDGAPEGSEVAPYFLCVWHAEVRVEVGGARVVRTGGVGVFAGSMGVAEAGVGTGLLVAGADLGGDGEGAAVVSDGFGTRPAANCVGLRLMAEQGLVNNGLHHEIYLSDVAETNTEKMRTILRQPVRAA